MIHDYDNPNTCYAIGDSFAVFLGTAATSRQPATGVFEQVSAVVKSSTTDELRQFDGTNALAIAQTDMKTHVDTTNATSLHQPMYNMALLIGNGVYIRKNGATDRIGVMGVQVDA